MGFGKAAVEKTEDCLVELLWLLQKLLSADLHVIHGPHVIHFSLPCLLQHAPVRLDEAAGAGRPATMLRASLRERRPLRPAAHVALPPAREGGRGSSGARARSADRRTIERMGPRSMSTDQN